MITYFFKLEKLIWLLLFMFVCLFLLLVKPLLNFIIKWAPCKNIRIPPPTPSSPPPPPPKKKKKKKKKISLSYSRVFIPLINQTKMFSDEFTLQTSVRECACAIWFDTFYITGLQVTQLYLDKIRNGQNSAATHCQIRSVYIRNSIE